MISFAKLKSRVTWPFADMKSVEIIIAIRENGQFEIEFTSCILSFEIFFYSVFCG